MGHRANFVVIENRAARVFADRWAALTCALVLRGGPAASRQWAEALKEDDGLIPSDSAEAGFLLDLDEATVIGFGDVADLTSLDEESAACAAALNRNPARYLKSIAAAWPSWKLVWDERGLATFASHIRKRAIDGINLDMAEAASADYAVFTVAVDAKGHIISSKRLRSAARKRKDEEESEPAELDGNDDWAGLMDCLPNVGFVSRAELERVRAAASPPWEVTRTRSVCEQLLADGELILSTDGMALAQNNGLNRDLLARKR